MYNTKFESIKQALEINKMSEKELVEHMKRYFDNQNYRSNYHAKKNLAMKEFKAKHADEFEALMKKVSGK